MRRRGGVYADAYSGSAFMTTSLVKQNVDVGQQSDQEIPDVLSRKASITENCKHPDYEVIVFYEELFNSSQ